MPSPDGVETTKKKKEEGAVFMWLVDEMAAYAEKLLPDHDPGDFLKGLPEMDTRNG